jgi:hypothetical protein
LADWLEVDFSGSKTINEIDVFSVQDNYSSPADPTQGMTFSQYGLRDFEVQYWNGTTWLPVPSGTITSNNLVWRQLTFAALSTTKIRVWVTAALNTWSRITEVEAYTAPPNTPPTVSITAPSNNSSFVAPATIASRRQRRRLATALRVSRSTRTGTCSTRIRPIRTVSIGPTSRRFLYVDRRGH